MGDALDFNLAGNWQKGMIYFCINEPILSEQDISKALICFKGKMDLSARPVPEPATLILLGSGLIGLAGYGKKRFKNNK